MKLNEENRCNRKQSINFYLLVLVGIYWFPYVHKVKSKKKNTYENIPLSASYTLSDTRHPDVSTQKCFAQKLATMRGDTGEC